MQDLIQQKLEELGLEVLLHLPSLLDLAPSDYDLFLSLGNYLVTKRFDDEAELKSNLDIFFSSLSNKFFEDWLLNLPKRWEHVINNNGVYVIDE